jgi:hypothetical protein
MVGHAGPDELSIPNKTNCASRTWVSGVLSGATAIQKPLEAVADRILTSITQGANRMSKGMDSKKQGKKEPAKTMKEKRAAKKAKKEGKGGLR